MESGGQFIVPADIVLNLESTGEFLLKRSSAGSSELEVDLNTLVVLRSLAMGMSTKQAYEDLIEQAPCTKEEFQTGLDGLVKAGLLIPMAGLASDRSSRDISISDGSVAVTVVVLPIYNGAPTMEKAIRSVLDQTQKLFRLVIVDDASTDDTLQIARGLAQEDERIVVLTDTVNHGGAWAINRGAAYLPCRYLAFINDDDTFEPSFLERATGVLAAKPEFDAVRLGYNLNQEIDPARYEMVFNSLPGNLVIRREVFDFIGGFPTNKEFSDFYAGYDVLLNRLLVWAFNTAIIEEKLYNYNPRPGGYFFRFLDSIRLVDGQIQVAPHNTKQKELGQAMAQFQEIYRQKVRALLASSIYSEESK